MGEIGERFHGANTGLALELRAQRFKIELGLQMMHAGLKERFAVQAAPEADGAEGLPLGEWLVREIDEKLVRSEIDVVEGDNFCDGLFEDLRTPARFPAGIKTLAELEAQLFPDLNQRRK